MIPGPQELLPHSPDDECHILPLKACLNLEDLNLKCHRVCRVEATSGKSVAQCNVTQSMCLLSPDPEVSALGPSLPIKGILALALWILHVQVSLT